MAGNFDRKLRLPRIHIRVLLHAANMRHGTNGFTSLPKEGVLRIFSLRKIRRLRPGLNRRTWVPKGSTLLLDHWSTLLDNNHSWLGLCRVARPYQTHCWRTNATESEITEGERKFRCSKAAVSIIREQHSSKDRPGYYVEAINSTADMTTHGTDMMDNVLRRAWISKLVTTEVIYKSECPRGNKNCTRYSETDKWTAIKNRKVTFMAITTKRDVKGDGICVRRGNQCILLWNRKSINVTSVRKLVRTVPTAKHCKGEPSFLWYHHMFQNMVMRRTTPMK